MILAKKIAFEKELKNIDISRMTGLHPTTISKVMNGKERPYPVQAKKIALALGCDTEPEAICTLFKEVGNA